MSADHLPPQGPAQIPMRLSHRTARGRDDFFESASNRLALDALDHWRCWPVGRMSIAGPRGSGKSHLLHVWAEETGAAILRPEDLAGADIPGLCARGAVALDDGDGLAKAGPEAEAALFHLHNMMAEEKGALLLAGREPPARWGAKLPDLASRLAAMPLTRIERPDDHLVAAVALKLFADRQMRVRVSAPETLAALAGTDLSDLERLVERIDRAALAARAPVTGALVRKVMAEAAAEAAAQAAAAEAAAEAEKKAAAAAKRRARRGPRKNVTGVE